MFSKICEMIAYDGLTYDELCSMAGGGGKDAQVTPIVPQPINTQTSAGSQLDIQVPTLDDSKIKENAVDKKKLGTRGLQIPLEAPTSTTNTESTPASTGLQI